MYNLIFIDGDNLETIFEANSLLEGLDLLEKLKGGLTILNVKKICLSPKVIETVTTEM